MITLDTRFRDAARQVRIELGGAVEPFAHLPYSKELTVKKAGLNAFFEGIRTDGAKIDRLAEAPSPRSYRTTSRRRVSIQRGKLFLTHGDGNNPGQASLLEPPHHASIYTLMESLLQQIHPQVQEIVNHVIVRGTYAEFVVIINVKGMDAYIVRTIRRVCEQVQAQIPEVQHAWMYHDPKGTRFYLELERPATGVNAKKLFGHAAWRQVVSGITYQVGVFSFSQINLEMMAQLVETVSSHAELANDDVLYDLYSGYGLFGAALSSQTKHVVAVDADETTVDNARYNIKRAGGHVTAIRQVFRDADDIASLWKTCTKIMRPQMIASSSVVTLDPPRSGTPAGMIREISRTIKPRRVVQVFCGPDELARSIREWKSAGYQLQRITPLDLFPGTFGIEIVASWEQADEPNEPSPAPTRTPRGNARPYGRSNYRRS
ncbi:MAG: methyltransferase [Ignavibacteria bacterium]|nr:methyltransferase [Ignavibacteria bacterium]